MLNREANSRFSNVPIHLDMPRSRMDRSTDHKTTFNSGELIPFYCTEILPGDTVELSTNFVIRMSTPLFPVMDNAFLDISYFFVPNRLIWDHWEEFNGENNDTFWTQPVEYNVPAISFPPGGWDKGSLADYFGIPTNFYNNLLSNAPSALPFRAYVKIYNDWWRDQNYMNPAYFSTDDSNRVGRRRSDYDTIDGGIESALYGGRPLQVAKFHDYFTSVLPAPQKGPAVSVKSNSNFTIPITTSVTPTPFYHLNPAPMTFYSSNANVISSSYKRTLAVTGGTGFDNTAQLKATSGLDSTVNTELIIPNNLRADIDRGQVSFLVNDMRLAFQLQRLYEKDALGGSRYIEILRSHFGVSSPDGRLQRSEYLGGSRVPINMSQVLQQSATASDGSTSPLGTTGAYSLTHHSDDSFIKSFTEHGWIIGLCCVRTHQSYQQGLNRMWTRKRRFDFYWPSLAHIGEQAVLKKEIYLNDPDGSLDPSTNVFDQAFGYQEAWADYRYHPNTISGAFRSNYQGSLDAWHYGNDFNGDPRNFVADAQFMYQSPSNIDRTLAVQSSLEDQFIADFYVKAAFTRVMPLYSVPGLIDHY